MDIKEHIESIVNVQNVGSLSNPKRPYVSTYDFILQHGQTHNPQKFYPDLFDGVPNVKKECFRNAYYLAVIHNLIYVEGVAHTVIPTTHAWCIDSDMNVYDPTWNNPEKGFYYGIPFDMDYIERKMDETGYFGVIDNVSQKFPLLTGVDTDFLYMKPK